MLVNRCLSLVTLVLILLLSAACASTSGDGDSDADTATVITNLSRSSQCISPISVYSIDGKEMTNPRQRFELPPGEHTLRGTALITGAFCQTTGMNTSAASLEPLIYEFEAGKRYFIGVNHRSNSSRGWFLTVWNVTNK